MDNTNRENILYECSVNLRVISKEIATLEEQVEACRNILQDNDVLYLNSGRFMSFEELPRFLANEWVKHHSIPNWFTGYGWNYDRNVYRDNVFYRRSRDPHVQREQFIRSVERSLSYLIKKAKTLHRKNIKRIALNARSYRQARRFGFNKEKPSYKAYRRHAGIH
jgi:hypothetical protein